MGEDQSGSSLGGYPLKVDAVPGRSSRSEYARLGAKLGVGVVANTKPVTWK
jgi:hypothetical protein